MVKKHLAVAAALVALPCCSTSTSAQRICDVKVSYSSETGTATASDDTGEPLDKGKQDACDNLCGMIDGGDYNACVTDCPKQGKFDVSCRDVP
jgi:hypothetical protein